MSLFQSALGFLAGTGSAAASRDQHDFVGQVVELGDTKLRIKRVIAEGEEFYPCVMLCFSLNSQLDLLTLMLGLMLTLV